MSETEGSPVAEPAAQTGSLAPTDGVGLCLSGGGYRAMLFHVGSLWRLMEAGRLTGATRIASVSGGSITAGVLALAWPSLAGGGMDAFRAGVVEPLRRMASVTVQTKAVLGGLFLPGTVAQRVAKAYAATLFGDRDLQALPDAPRFVFTATNLETGTLFRFSKREARDWRVGAIDRPRFRLADVVAASSAFPPFLSPFVLDVEPGDFGPLDADAIRDDRFRKGIALTDGGVYDNLGLEPVWKSCRTVLVSDGGGRLADDPSPTAAWVGQSKRVLEVVDHQVRNLRKRQVVGSLERGERDGAYWGIRTDIADYKLATTLPCPHAATMRLAEIATGLERMVPRQQEQLINWGYAVCDAALRRHVDPAIAVPGGFPYPASGIG